MSKLAKKRDFARSTSAAKPQGTPPAIPVAAVEKIFGATMAYAHSRHALLTNREVEVADLVARGKPNRQIAEELGISPKTLDIHRANVMHKLEARTTARVASLVHLVRLNEVDAK